ncbi:hypothetical protein PIIN_09234 [Serendipita indica DSM 11827]|uniref:Uncharacterized protein n=1 Tax=Serendipita indica (strain DSM 11827) TaxID=1109443 RepID=G4TVA7_SERID|nr:hypothetical protein PIIN_09234 [Serendipita indica DSM 11827]
MSIRSNGSNKQRIRAGDERPQERERRIGRDGTRRPNSADAEPIGQKQRMANANKEEQEKAQRGLGGDAG